MIRITLAAAAIALTGGAALAAPFGATSVTITAPLGALGLTGSPVGTATLSTAAMSPVFSFPITALGPVIEHDGSGVELSAGALSIAVGNFDVDTVNAVLRGDVLDDMLNPVAGFEDLDLFTLGMAGMDGIPLLISATLAAALEDTFGTPSIPDDFDFSTLAGAEFGLAAVNPIPLPAAAPLLLAGLGGLAALRIRRKAGA